MSRGAYEDATLQGCSLQGFGDVCVVVFLPDAKLSEQQLFTHQNNDMHVLILIDGYVPEDKASPTNYKPRTAHTFHD